MRARVDIVGGLGAGKTTLLRTLAASLSSDWCIIEEDLERIQGQRAWWRECPDSRTFFMQCAYYRLYFEQVRDVVLAASDVCGVVCDSSLAGHHFVYSKLFLEMGWLTLLEWEELERIRSTYEAMLPPLCAIIVRDASVDVVLQRIALRARPDEAKVPRDFVRSLLEGVGEFKTTVSVPCLVVSDDLEAPEGQSVVGLAAQLLSTIR